jgi:hypothetical protein
MHPVYFPNVISNFYWTATTNANNTDEAWTVIFQDGTAIYNRQKLEINSVRAVRGGQSTGILMDNKDGTVTDTATGLMRNTPLVQFSMWNSRQSCDPTLKMGDFAK